MGLAIFKYSIINRTGERILGDATSIDSIGAAGIAKVVGADHTCSLFRAEDKSLHPLPATIEGKRALYVANPYCPASHTIVGYCLEEKREGQTESLLDCSLLPENTCAVSSFTLDAEMNLLSKPVPYDLDGFEHSGSTTLARDVHEHLYLIGRKGDILRQFPAEWQHEGHAYDDNHNVSELIFSKITGNSAEYVQEGSRRREIIYRLGIEQDIVSGPYTEIDDFCEGIRYVRGVDGLIRCVDKDFHTLFTTPHQRKYPCFATISPCCHGHVAFTTGWKAGLLNKAGDIVVKPKFSHISHIHGPYWWYQKGRKYGILHESGELITEALYFACPYFGHEFGSGIVPAGTTVKRKEKWGYIDLTGQWVIPPQFDLCYGFHHRDFAIVRDEI